VAKTLTVPPNLVRRAREGTYGLLAVAAQAIVGSAYASEQPEPTSRTNLDLQPSVTRAAAQAPRVLYLAGLAWPGA
jgi:hypothetical protein